MTTQPCSPILGEHSFDTVPPTDIRQMSVPLKSKFSSDLHFKTLSPKETSVPIERGDASATTSSAGNRRSARISSISRPTFPVAPTTASLKPIFSSVPKLLCNSGKHPGHRQSPSPIVYPVLWPKGRRAFSDQIADCI